MSVTATRLIMIARRGPDHEPAKARRNQPCNVMQSPVITTARELATRCAAEGRYVARYQVQVGSAPAQSPGLIAGGCGTSKLLSEGQRELAVKRRRAEVRPIVVG